MNNYTIYHLHSDFSNGTTNIDSVTKYQEYIERAKECDMTTLGFAEHGNLFSWFHKKEEIEKAGMKYIHACEVYVTYKIDKDENDEPIRVKDNYHCVLIAKNLDGFYELNELVSTSFNRKDGHYYYVPRITFDELQHTSDNIIITSACIGGMLSKCTDDKQLQEFINFFIRNKYRCYLEIQHHADVQQIQYNQFLYRLHLQYKIPLIAGTDTHGLNNDHIRGRKILQLSKGIEFPDEDGWDMTFKTYDELVQAYERQGAIARSAYMQAIENTNVLADSVEAYEIDCNTKYPKIYDNPEQTFMERIERGINEHPYLLKNHTREEVDAIVKDEFEIYKTVGAIDYMLLETYLKDWEVEHNIFRGPGRGSVSGSMIAYILGITDMDSKRFNLNMFRFLNPERASMADIDSDYGEADRDKVKEFLLRDKLGLSQITSSEIVTFNTVALKGAIRDVGRALQIPLQTVSDIVKRADSEDETVRDDYPELFEYVDIVNGTITSIGSHPSGVLIWSESIERNFGTCSIAGSAYPVCMLNMKELDALKTVKLDRLGLSNEQLIIDTCSLAGIERLTPDNVCLDDIDVWKSIRDDTTLIFQYESNSAQAYLRKFMSDETMQKVGVGSKIDYLTWFSFGNGLLRPACASYRDEVAKGIPYDNGMTELNEFLAPTLGYLCMQEDIMNWCSKFCGYSMGKSDLVRRAIAKKYGTEQLLPEIKHDFIEYSSATYGVSKELCESVIDPFLKVIQDASAYAFSWNHSQAYSFIGYAAGYLRYYYPYEFITTALNVFDDDSEKTASIMKYANKIHIKIIAPKFGVSRGNYFYNKDEQSIAKGIASVKFFNAEVADEIFELSKTQKFDSFMSLLTALKSQTSIDARQREILIKLGYFRDFGNINELLEINRYGELFKYGSARSIDPTKIGERLSNMILEFCNPYKKDGKPASRWAIVDMNGLLNAIEQDVLQRGLVEPTIQEKAAYSQEYMGYTDIHTNNPDDRRKLYISDARALLNKFNGGVWKWNLFCVSIGSGLSSVLSLSQKQYKELPVQKGNVIYADYVKQDEKGYWNLMNYHILER